MHTIRVIPCLDVDNGRVVKGVNFVNLKDAGDPVEIAAAYDIAGADEVVFLDITASSDERKTAVKLAADVASKLFIPYTVGGGIRSVEDFRNILREGADKVAVNSAAILNPSLISEAAEKFGSQCVVVAIDARRCTDDYKAPSSDMAPDNRTVRVSEPAGKWTIYLKGGRVDTGIDAVEWAKEAERLGAGEILLTSMDRDGTKSGFDNELTRAVADSVNIPVIASGGAGSLEHFAEAVYEGHADAVLAASLFHYKELEISEVKRYMQDQGIEVRF